MVPQNRTLKKYRMKKSPIIPQYRKPTCPPQEAKTFPSCVKYVVASSLVRINLMIDSFVVLICFSLMKISLVSRNELWGGPNLFICALVMFLNRVFRQGRFNRFLWFLASLIKNSRTLRKCYLSSFRYKKVWDIGICLKPHFDKKCQ